MESAVEEGDGPRYDRKTGQERPDESDGDVDPPVLAQTGAAIVFRLRGNRVHAHDELLIRQRPSEIFE